MVKKLGSIDKTNLFLIKLINDKVVTESELLKILGWRGVDKLHSMYKRLVVTGYPIRRKVVYQEASRPSARSRVNHRAVVYYLG